MRPVPTIAAFWDCLLFVPIELIALDPISTFTMTTYITFKPGSGWLIPSVSKPNLNPSRGFKEYTQVHAVCMAVQVSRPLQLRLLFDDFRLNDGIVASVISVDNGSR